MSERTDQEQGTEPETTADWIHDLEGDSDVPAAGGTPAGPDTERGADDPVREAGRDSQG